MLIEFLIGKFKYLSPDQWIERINEGRFTIGTEVCTSDRILQINDVLVYDAPPFIEPDADLSYQIIFETEDFLAVNKPGNLLVHKKGASVTHNLIYQLREIHDPKFPNADIVNRLDRETSGIVLVSKNKNTLRTLSDLFVHHGVEKEYFAIVNGVPKEKSGTISHPLMPDPSGTVRSRQIISDQGKSAETTYSVISEWGNRSLIQLFPKTGRTHQLRVHLASLGCPIVGDKLYGMHDTEYQSWRKDPTSIELEFPRHALHCRSVSFQFKNETYTIHADFPADMRSLIPEAHHI